jgi:hypothetical protein
MVMIGHVGQLTGTIKATRGLKSSKTATTFKTKSHSSLSVSHETVKAGRLQNWFQSVHSASVLLFSYWLMFHCWIRIRAIS